MAPTLAATVVNMRKPTHRLAMRAWAALRTIRASMAVQGWMAVDIRAPPVVATRTATHSREVWMPVAVLPRKVVVQRAANALVVVFLEGAWGGAVVVVRRRQGLAVQARKGFLRRHPHLFGASHRVPTACRARPMALAKKPACSRPQHRLRGRAAVRKA